MPKLPDDWLVPDWPVPVRVRALITSRNGGNSVGPYASMNLGLRVDDAPGTVTANRQLLAQYLPADPRWLEQVHGTSVVAAEAIVSPVRADGSFSRRPGCVNVVMVADCLPMLFADRSGSIVGAAHAGWRGLAGGIVENAVRALATPPEDLFAYLGPAIGPSAFEVGDDVRDVFIAADRDADHAFLRYKPGKWLADIFMLARQRLDRSGVRNVYGGGLCTYSNPARFFSHRRDRVSGRMAALIWIED